MQAHLRRHFRFYVAVAVGTIAWVACSALNVAPRASIAGDAFFACYLILVFALIRRFTPKEMRRRAESRDEGIAVIVLITVATIGLSLGSIFSAINSPQSESVTHLVLAGLSVPLGWTTLHTIMAFHYAHLFYTRHPTNRQDDQGGLSFPDTPEPGIWEFLYYSFVIGMTAQVSDVQVASTEMRRVTLVHGVVSFFFNAVIIALAVNVAVSQH